MPYLRPILALCVLLLATQLYAANPSLVESRRQDLQEQTAAITNLQAALEKKRAEVAALREHPPKNVTDAMVEAARIAKDAAELEQQDIELDTQASAHMEGDLADAIEPLQEKLKALRVAKDSGPERQEALAKAEASLEEKLTLLELEKTQHKLLGDQATLAKEKLQLAQELWSILLQQHDLEQSAQREEALAELAKRLEMERNRLLELRTRLNEQLAALPVNGSEVEADKSLLQAQIRDTEESIFLIELQLQGEQSAYTLRQLEKAAAARDLDAQRLAAMVDEASKLVAGLNTTQNLAESKLALLSQLKDITAKRRPTSPNSQAKQRREQQIVSDLADRFERQLAVLHSVGERAAKAAADLQSSYQATVQKGLTARHSLPTELFEWKALSEELLLLPQALAKAGGQALAQFQAALIQASPARWAALLLVETLCCLGWLYRSRLPTLEDVARQRGHSFAETAADVVLALLRDNALGLLLCGLTLLGGWVVGTDARAMGLLGLGWALWFGGRLPLAVAYWLLLSPLVARADWKEHLYRILFWFVLLNALLAFFIILGVLEIITEPLRDLFERAFMLFIALSFLPALRIRPKVMAWLETRTALRRRWLKVMRLSSLLFVVSVLTATLLGVAGYLNMAWSVAQHLAWLLVVVTAWYILRGLLQDLASKLKNVAMERSDQGVLWAQDIIDPLSHLARALLAVGAALALFQLYGWGPESPIAHATAQFLTHPLFQVGEQSMHLARLLLIGLFLALLLSTTRWLRTFSFRWLYCRVGDIGVRNSLAAFTQYAFFLAGVLIALKILGIDLTSVAIFTGAVGVGIGLGLQNIANNFISGIILLLERPLRAKDLVTVAGIEGEVKDIGIRAVTVKTPDNQDVIIPNAEIVGHSLINWTRSDRVLRTVFTVSVSYDDNPRLAREIILKTVREHASVLQEPMPTVWLSEFGSTGVNFTVQYFVNIEQFARLEVKSHILLALWDALSAAGMSVAPPPPSVPAAKG